MTLLSFKGDRYVKSSGSYLVLKFLAERTTIGGDFVKMMIEGIHDECTRSMWRVHQIQLDCAPPHMGKILHSGEYWQMLRRRRQERLAREARGEGGQSSRRSEGDGAAVYTFTPGRTMPIVGVQVAFGSVSSGQPAASTSASRAAVPRPRKQARPVVTTNSILASRARDDEILLARLQGPRDQGLKRKRRTSSPQKSGQRELMGVNRPDKVYTGHTAQENDIRPLLGALFVGPTLNPLNMGSCHTLSGSTGSRPVVQLKQKLKVYEGVRPEVGSGGGTGAGDRREADGGLL
ncbi:hypothetical protein C8R43DRAFT_942174 [Mycena crocata]|nr:hypothetical protein C8R43DRAFT_942174 [Mycena crocata]